MDRDIRLLTSYHEVRGETLSIRVNVPRGIVASLVQFVVGPFKGLVFFLVLPFVAVPAIVLALLHRPVKGLVALCRRAIRHRSHA